MKQPRFVVEVVEGGEQIRIKAARSWFALPFITLWLLIWSIGGIATMSQLAGKFDLFLLVWLCLWAGGCLLAAVTIAWQLGGAEIIRSVGGDLEVGYAMPGRSGRRLFRGSEIGRLRVRGGAGEIVGMMHSAYPPFLSGQRAGSISFDHGARTHRFAIGLDEAEAAMIVDYLRKRLPAGATEKRG